MADKMKFGFSPCPNDTFMLGALFTGKIATDEFLCEPHILDIEELNSQALEGNFDICKISFHSFPLVSNNYQVLQCGAALGESNGPILVCKPGNEEKAQDATARLAIPGMHTTANLLVSLFYPDLVDKTAILFSTIEDAVLNGDYDLGVIIHENRFTYEAKGLVKVADLGEAWKEQNFTLLPLGGIVVKRRMQMEAKKKIEELIRSSIVYAFQHPDEILPFVRQHAQSLSDDVIMQHIRMFVNHYSVNLGIEGISAVRALFRRSKQVNVYNFLTEPVFVD
ncbi:MAG: 1,4-dihydroxy-6-naphthoate synthase [Bacteroidetes bacterium]|nr:1,4-dihydroxy-6-naphthoate synthase [Bacteroidota bacterium]